MTAPAKVGHRSHSNRERSIGVVVLIDCLAGTLCVITAAIYLALKVLNVRIFADHPQMTDSGCDDGEG